MPNRRSVHAVAFVMLIGAAAFAQSNLGTITGTISDPAGAVVAAAQIEARNSGTGVVYRGGTSNTGNYVISVPSGTYELTVNVPGFKKFVQSNIQVVTATDSRKDVTLEIGSASEAVTVTDTAPPLKTESGEMSHTVDIKEVDSLPVLTISGGTYTGLDHGADPNLADKDGKAALSSRPNARLKGRPPYRGGANRSWLNQVGATPFYRAAASDDVHLMRLLIAYGADPSIPANDNSTPLMVATGVGFIPGNSYIVPENEALEALRLCLEVNDVNAVNNAGLTALHAAAFRGWNAAVKALVNDGAKLDAKDKQGRTPMQWADGLYRGGGIAPVWHDDTVALLKQLSKR